MVTDTCQSITPVLERGTNELSAEKRIWEEGREMLLEDVLGEASLWHTPVFLSLDARRR